MYYVSADIHSLFSFLSWSLTIDSLSNPSFLFQILIDLSVDPLIMYYSSADIHKLVIESSWALSIYLMSFPLIFQILIDLSLDPLMMYY